MVGHRVLLGFHFFSITRDSLSLSRLLRLLGPHASYLLRRVACQHQEETGLCGKCQPETVVMDLPVRWCCSAKAVVRLAREPTTRSELAEAVPSSISDRLLPLVDPLWQLCLLSITPLPLPHLSSISCTRLILSPSIFIAISSISCTLFEPHTFICVQDFSLAPLPCLLLFFFSPPPLLPLSSPSLPSPPPPLLSPRHIWTASSCRNQR